MIKLGKEKWDQIGIRYRRGQFLQYDICDYVFHNIWDNLKRLGGGRLSPM